MAEAVHFAMFSAVAAAFLPEPVFPEFFSEQAEGHKEETTHHDAVNCCLQLTIDASGIKKICNNQIPSTSIYSLVRNTLGLFMMYNF